MQELPKKERTFSFETEGELTKRKYDGEFTVHAVLNMGLKHQLELEKTILQADTKSPTPGLRGIASVIAELRVRIIDGPEFWKQSLGGMRIEDENVIFELYDKVTAQEAEWRKELEESLVKQEGKADPNSPKESSTKSE